MKKEPKKEDSFQQILLQIQSMSFKRREGLSEGQRVHYQELQRNFNRIAVDMMRVFTTEPQMLEREIRGNKEPPAQILKTLIIICKLTKEIRDEVFWGQLELYNQLRNLLVKCIFHLLITAKVSEEDKALILLKKFFAEAMDSLGIFHAANLGLYTKLDENKKIKFLDFKAGVNDSANFIIFFLEKVLERSENYLKDDGDVKDGLKKIQTLLDSILMKKNFIGRDDVRAIIINLNKVNKELKDGTLLKRTLNVMLSCSFDNYLSDPLKNMKIECSDEEFGRDRTRAFSLVTRNRSYARIGKKKLLACQDTQNVSKDMQKERSDDVATVPDCERSSDVKEQMPPDKQEGLEMANLGLRRRRGDSVKNTL